jgi:hypothetical protein
MHCFALKTPFPDLFLMQFDPVFNTDFVFLHSSQSCHLGQGIGHCSWSLWASDLVAVEIEAKELAGQFTVCYSIYHFIHGHNGMAPYIFYPLTHLSYSFRVGQAGMSDFGELYL